MASVESKRSLPAQFLSEVAVSLVVYGMMAVPMLIMWELSLQHASDQAAPADSNRATFAINAEREGQRIVGEAKCADKGPGGALVPVLEAKLCITPETGSPLVRDTVDIDSGLVEAGICQQVPGDPDTCDRAHPVDPHACFWTDARNPATPIDPRSQHRVSCWVLRLTGDDPVVRSEDPNFGTLLERQGRLEIVDLAGSCDGDINGDGNVDSDDDILCDNYFAAAKDVWAVAPDVANDPATTVVAWGLLDDPLPGALGNPLFDVDDTFQCRFGTQEWRQCDRNRDPVTDPPATELKVSVCFRLPFWRIPTVNSPTCTPATTTVELGR